MGNINLYRVDNNKYSEFLKMLSFKLKFIENKEVETDNSKIFSFTLFLSAESKENELSWYWILKAFDQPEIKTISQPKAIIYVENDDSKTCYAVTFGSSFFLVDKFCDRNFGFDFARKLTYDEIKTTTLTTPNSCKNKTVNTYINYNELTFDSGESFTKIKAKIEIDEDFTLFNPSIEIGNSIKLSTSNETLQNIAKIILYVEEKLKEDDKCLIPVFSKISDKEYINSLDSDMKKNVKNNPDIAIAELEIIGADEVFNRSDDEFLLKYEDYECKISNININEIKEFCKSNGLSYSDVLLDIKVIKFVNGSSVATYYVRDMIEYTNDKERCLLSGGKWYRFNDDYLTYLNNSLSEIEAVYNPEYDFTSEIHNQFIDEVYLLEKDLPQYVGKSKQKIKKALKSIYYAENAFNRIREKENGFISLDRAYEQIDKSRVEPMDLYKDNCIFAVKIGNSSEKLCYAVDQSLTTVKLFKQGLLPKMKPFNTVVIWLVLERKTHIENKAGIPDINKLNLLMLKNRIDQWKKEIRLSGYIPKIYINYREK